MFRIKNKHNLLLIWLPFFVLYSCDTRKGVDRNAVRQEMEARELKRIPEGAIMAKGEEIGRTTLEKTQKIFQQELTNALTEKGVAGAIQYCNLNAYTLVKELEDSLDIKISRATDKPRNPSNSLSGVAKEIFDAYQYAPENATAQLQELDEKTLIYNKPIKISSGMCLSCHGQVGTDISRENYEYIKSLYPKDKATGYHVGALRGMWSIKIPKKAVVELL